jgi:hypothetical protein
MVQGEEENIVHDEADGSDVRKYEDLLKKANKSLHNKTKHSKLSVTVHLYNLKCVGELSIMIFSSFLKFINQLLPADDGALLVNTYKTKMFLRDMGLGYEKILTCCNDCMLFLKGNKELDSCVKCGESK